MNIPTSETIYIMAYGLLSLVVLLLLAWVRRLRKAIRVKDYDLERLIEFLDKAFDDAKQAAIALAEKNRSIDSIQQQAQDQQERAARIHAEGLKIEARLRAQVQIMQEILVRVSPGARFIIHHPAKLSAWLERLKAGKGKKKAKSKPYDPSQELREWTKSLTGEEYQSQTLKNQ